MIFDLLMRWIHILAAITLVGGTFFLRFSLAPALAGQSPQLQQTLLAAWRPRWARLVMIASGLLLLSGLVNAVRNIIAYQFPGAPYHALVAVKLLLSLVIFWLSAVLAGRSDLAQRFREKLSFWLTVNVMLAIAIVGLAGYMKGLERIPKADQPARTSTHPAVPPTERERIGQESQKTTRRPAPTVAQAPTAARRRTPTGGRPG
jgi:hypothetical protein